MNPQELELASKIMSELRNTTGYGYETLVKGTVIGGLLDVSATTLSIIVASAAAYIAYRLQSNREDRHYDDIPPFWCAVICFIIGGIAALMIFSIISSALLAVFAPEYTVINGIIEKAAGQ